MGCTMMMIMGFFSTDICGMVGLVMGFTWQESCLCVERGGDLVFFSENFRSTQYIFTKLFCVFFFFVCALKVIWS